MSVPGSPLSTVVAQSSQVAESCFGMILSTFMIYLRDRPAGAESVGFDIGMRLGEYGTASRPRLLGDIEIIRYLCKDFWKSTFGRAADKLQTNRSGLYVIQDTSFSWISFGVQENKELAALYAQFASGVVRGALAALGVPASVRCELELPGPGCSFHVSISEDRLRQR